MYIALLVSVLLILPGSLAEFVITAHDYGFEDSSIVSTKGPFGFDVGNFLKKNGYPFENHEVTTEDGYVLAMHRIPYGRNSTVYNASDKETKPAVLIVHAVVSSSTDFLILGPERSLPMLLADQGYDVWLGNNRGNTWSRKHVTLDPDKNTSFWDFSFHELGLYDAVSMIDYIIKETGNEQISYIGHSQGTTQFFALASQKPEYNNKVNIMMAMAPAVYCQNVSSPLIQIIKDHYILVELITNYLNVTEVLSHSFLLETALKLICKDGSKFQEVCTFILFFIAGFDSSQLDRSDFNTMLEVFPSGLSIKELKHYLQLVKSGTFRQFDHGILKNLEIYNKSTPPVYNISLVTAPVALYYGKNDLLVSVTNVDQLADDLPNVVEKHLIEYDYFNHLDFVIAKDIVSLLYYDLINKLNDVNGLDPFTTTTTVSTSTTTAATTATTTTILSSTSSSNSTVSPEPTSTSPTNETTPHPGSSSSVNKCVFMTFSCIFIINVLISM